jgi:hypothetical protein
MPGRGRNQLLAQAAAERAAVQPCMLADRLLEICFWGLISPTLVRWLAEGALLSGLEHPDIVALSELGSSGLHKQNIRRDLLRRFLPSSQLPKPALVWAPYVPTQGDRTLTRYTKIPVLMPNEMFDCFFHCYKTRFFQMLGEGVPNFWSKVGCLFFIINLSQEKLHAMSN